jgi:hypothetical protein
MVLIFINHNYFLLYWSCIRLDVRNLVNFVVEEFYNDGKLVGLFDICRKLRVDVVIIGKIKKMG